MSNISNMQFATQISKAILRGDTKMLLPTGKLLDIPTGQKAGTMYQQQTYADQKALKIIDEFKLNISKKEKNKMYKNNDILILPTKHKSETTPGVIDECINHGVIPIAFNQGDIKGQIGEMGLVANNYIQMKKKLLMVFKNYNKIKKRIIDNKKIKLNTVSQKLKILDNIFYN